MGVVKKSNQKKKNDLKNDLVNGKSVDKVKKKKKVSCLQCIKPVKDDGGIEGKYRVAAPELMQDTFMSDSEDEGGEVECPIQQQQQYRYMNTEAGTLHRAKPLEDSVTDGHRWPSNNDRKVATIDRQPLDIGFLVSFVVDARGGAMKAKRRGGVRIIVPPAACSAPTRVTCRAATRRAPAAAPPPLMEGEALASRLLELQPQGAKFLAPVIIEVPIYTASCKEREIVILRSDTGETWQDHYLHNNDNPMIQEALQRERQDNGSTGESLGENGERVTRVVTCDFPHYLCVVSRVRQEVHIIGPEGGTVSSTHIPQVQALFPAQALTKRIRVGVQAHGASSDLTKRLLPRHAAVSPVLTVEPRRRKFHRSITLTAPLPKLQGGPQDKQSTSNLRLLCSIMGGQARAVWEDVTGSTPLTVTEDCASFTTTVSARFWLMNCQNVSDATKLATELYREMLLVPFEVRIVVLGKRLDALEGRLLVLYITDRYAYDTLLQQEHYTEVAHSTAVRFLDGKEVYLEFSGNLVPVTKSGSQPMFTFEAFKDNRVEFTVRVKHHEERPSGRVYFMNEPKVPKGEQSQTPTCVLDVELPERIAPRAGKSQVDYLNLDQSGFDALKDELSFNWNDHNHSIGPPSLPHQNNDHQLNGHDKILTNGNVKYPTKPETEDKSATPQVNGDTLHVDSNKAKATFDSDEDKTPMNTLEKGKKKPETGFFGGLADKVKNVFTHSEDHDDEKESSPKPQPKPRESKEKEKTPPKPAPRIINEDLLDKVEDMFKDLNQKPPKVEEDLESKVYRTKLIVDEGEKPLEDIKEELYDQYIHMQPVDTPLHSKMTDPFAIYTGCCEGRYKKGEKHRHDDASTNLTEKCDNITFTTHETIQEVNDRLENNVNDSLDKLAKEKDNIKENTSEISEDLHREYDILKDDIKNKELNIREEVENVQKAVENKVNDITDSANNAHEDVLTKASNLKDKVTTEVENFNLNIQDTSKQERDPAADAKEVLTNKFNEMNFAAMERAEALKTHGHDKVVHFDNTVDNTAENIKDKLQETGADLKQKANDGAITIIDSIHRIQDNVNDKAQNLKAGAQETSEHVKEATNEKLHELGESVDEAKAKVSEAVVDVKKKAGKTKDKAKNKSKEGKNFFTGLVHNIFGEKDKIEDELKGKIAEGKDSVNKAVNEASAKKDEMKEGIAAKEAELKQNADNVIQNAQDKQDQFKKDLQNKKDETEKTIQDKTNEVSQALHDKKNEIESTVQTKKEEIYKSVEDTKDDVSKTVQDTKDQVGSKITKVENAIHEVKDNALTSLNETKNEIEHKASDIGKSLSDTKDNVLTSLHEKKDEVDHAIQNKAYEIGKTIHETHDNVLYSLQEKRNDIQNTAQNKFQEIGSTIHDTAENVQSSLHDKKEDVKHKAEQIGATIQEKTDETKQAFQDHADNVKHVVFDRKDEIVESIHNTTDQARETIQTKKEELGKAICDKKNDIEHTAESELERIRHEAELATDEISKTAENTLNAAADKKAEFQCKFNEKFDEVQQSGKEEIDRLRNAGSDKANELQRSSKQAFDDVQNAALSTFDKVESSTKDYANTTKDTWEDLQSSTRDTYADFRDDVQGLDNSAQDTLHSFQSSAGNTFDSLDDSAREVFVGGVQNLENSGKELFGDTRDAFEGFQISADNKLEDVKGAASDRLEEAGDRLGEFAESVGHEMKGKEQAVVDTVSSEADKFTSSLNDLGNSVFGSSGKGFMKDSSSKLLESEKTQSSPHKKGSGIPKLKRKK